MADARSSARWLWGTSGSTSLDLDPRYRDLESAALGEVVDRVRGHGGRIVNVDATVAADAPSAGGWLEAMRSGLAETLGLAVRLVSVKAKRAERLGALGRQEGSRRWPWCWSRWPVSPERGRSGNRSPPGFHLRGNGARAG